MIDPQENKPADKVCARRVRNGDRIVVLPPEGCGDAWGGARR